MNEFSKIKKLVKNIYFRFEFLTGITIDKFPNFVKKVKLKLINFLSIFEIN